MSNQTKSYVMKYNQFCKGHVYDKETLKEIYNAMIEYNKKYDYKKKDLNMFKGYDFYSSGIGGDTSQCRNKLINNLQKGVQYTP